MTREQATKKLGVSPTATEAEIKAAYKRLAKMYHPDNNSDPVAEIVYREVKEAYEALCDMPKQPAAFPVGGGTAMRGKAKTVGGDYGLKERRRQQEKLDKEAAQKRKAQQAKQEKAQKELYERRKVLELRKALNSFEMQQLISAIEQSMQESTDRRNEEKAKKLREAFEAYYKNQEDEKQ